MTDDGTDELFEHSRQLRSRPTEAEHRLWQRLRHRQLGGVKFRRQVPVGPYIVDFLSYDINLVIELDGGQHAEDRVRRRDERRTAYLESKGFRVLRFWNPDVFKELDAVLTMIAHAIDEARNSGAD